MRRYVRSTYLPTYVFASVHRHNNSNIIPRATYYFCECSFNVNDTSPCDNIVCVLNNTRTTHFGMGGCIFPQNLKLVKLNVTSPRVWCIHCMQRLLGLPRIGVTEEMVQTRNRNCHSIASLIYRFNYEYGNSYGRNYYD